MICLASGLKSWVAEEQVTEDGTIAASVVENLCSRQAPATPHMIGWVSGRPKDHLAFSQGITARVGTTCMVLRAGLFANHFPIKELRRVDELSGFCGEAF